MKPAAAMTMARPRAVPMGAHVRAHDAPRSAARSVPQAILRPEQAARAARAARPLEEAPRAPETAQPAKHPAAGEGRERPNWGGLALATLTALDAVMTAGTHMMAPDTRPQGPVLPPPTTELVRPQPHRVAPAAFPVLPAPVLVEKAAAASPGAPAASPRAAPRVPQRIATVLPEIMTKHRASESIRYRLLLNAELFGTGGPQPKDVAQGRTGDCYMLATAAALASSDPAAVESMFVRTGPDSYRVRFFVADEAAPEGRRAVWIDVTLAVPMDSRKVGKGAPEATTKGQPRVFETPGEAVYDLPLLDSATGKRVVWVALLEQAYAKFNDRYPVAPEKGIGYDGIGKGGQSSQAYFAVTGQSQASFTFNDRLFGTPKPGSRVKDKVARMVADERRGSPSGLPLGSEQLWQALSRANQGGVITLSSRRSFQNGAMFLGPKQPGLSIAGQHAYAVLGTREQGGERFVRLMNPWGYYVPGDATKSRESHGVFELTLEQVRRHFWRIHVPVST